MRLKPEERKIIKDAVNLLDPEARVFLFGSRVDPNRQGGDIDLIVISKVLRNIDSIGILKEIYKQMEEQKIDILITSDVKDPFVDMALDEGIEL